MNRSLFYAFLFFYTMAIIYLASVIPIGKHEATVYYTNNHVLYFLTHFFDDVFTNSLSFRLPFVLFGFINISLFLIMSSLYFEKREESYLATTIYLLLPGIITSTVLVNISVIVISLVLFFVIFYEKNNIWGQVVSMLLLLLVHDASIIFFIALVIYFTFKREYKFLFISIVFIVVSLFYFNGLAIGGRPVGEFPQLFGLYVVLFSPLVFLYFFYALYRILLREKKDILWYISFTAFVLSILLSLRQQVDMSDFAPYVIISVVLMLVTYHKTLYVRLPQYRATYFLGFKIVLVSLLLSTMIIVFHQLFFYVIQDKSKHFAYAFYEPYWQVAELKEIGQNCYTVSNKKVQYQLKYYGIESCKEENVPKIHK